MSKPNLEAITKFFAEVGILKQLPKMGMIMAGTLKESTVGQHVTRAAQIGYVLAFLEEADPEKVASILLFHDNGEIRIGDQNKIAARYYDNSQAEQDAYFDQMNDLPAELGQKLKSYFQEFEDRQTKEAMVAKDADWLETAITAKEAMEQGASPSLQTWINNVKKSLHTDSAKKILQAIEVQEDFTSSWWKGLKKID